MTKTMVANSQRAKSRRQGTQATVERRVARNNRQTPEASLSERKTIEELAAEQGTKPTRLEDILGRGADLWESDQEFEQFVEDIYARRSEGRALAKQ